MLPKNAGHKESANILQIKKILNSFVQQVKIEKYYSQFSANILCITVSSQIVLKKTTFSILMYKWLFLIIAFLFLILSMTYNINKDKKPR